MPCRLFSLAALVVVAVGVLVAPVRAQDLATDRAVLEDPSGRLTFEEARQRTFTPYRGFLNEGYTRSVYWIRFTLRPVPPSPSEPARPGAGWAIVRMRPVFVDHVELFDPGQPSGRRRLAGDRHEWLDSEHPSLSHTFVVRTGVDARQLWLRVQTTSARVLQFEVLRWDAAAEAERRDDLRAMLLLVLLVTLALAGVVVAVSTRTATDYAFAAMETTSLPCAMYILGYLRPLTAGTLPATVVDVGFSIAVFVAVHASCWFFHMFVIEHRPSRLGRWIVTVPLFLLPVLVLMTIAGALELALHVNACAIGILPVAMLLASLTCTAWQPGSDVRPALPRWLYLGATGTCALGSGVWFASASGWLTSTSVLQYGMIWFTALIGVVMLAVLLVRTRRIAAMRADALLRAEIAESRAVTAGLRHAERTQLFSLLTHEVRTGLSVIRMAVAAPAASDDVRAVAEQALDSISRVVERCGEAQVGAEPEPFAIAPCSVGPLLDSIRAAMPAPARVIIAIDQDLDEVVTDAVTLRRLLRLLVENALMHGAQDAPVDLVATIDRRQAGGTLVWVSNLPGVSGWPDPGQVFGKYYRSPGARRTKGAGLGLHLAATLAEQLGGRLRYAPSATHIRFVVWLPR